MTTIWKYELSPDVLFYDLPRGAKILSAREQGETICFWAEVDPGAPKEPRKMMAFGTGHTIPQEPMRFVGTAYLQHGSLVFHVYEGRRGMTTNAGYTSQ